MAIKLLPWAPLDCITSGDEGRELVDINPISGLIARLAFLSFSIGLVHGRAIRRCRSIVVARDRESGCDARCAGVFDGLYGISDFSIAGGRDDSEM